MPISGRRVNSSPSKEPNNGRQAAPTQHRWAEGTEPWQCMWVRTWAPAPIPTHPRPQLAV